MTAPRLGESCDLVMYACVRRRKPAGGSKTLEEDADCRHDERPSRTLQVDGGRARSSRDACDILVSKLQAVGSIECWSQGRLEGSEHSD